MGLSRLLPTLLAAFCACDSLDSRARCVEGKCPEPAICEAETQTCVLAPAKAREMVVTSPAPNAVVKPDLAVRLQLVERVKLEDGPPASIPFSITDSGGALKVAGALPRHEDGSYGPVAINSLMGQTLTDGDYFLTLQGTVRGLITTTSRFTVDGTKPDVQFVLGPPNRVSPQPGATVVDDPGSTSAWRRDERPILQVSSDEPHLDPSTVRVTLFDIAADGNAAAPSKPLPVVANGNCGHLFCGIAVLELAQPKMQAFRGVFKMQVSGKDLAGNEGTAIGAVPVTRWKWRQAGLGPMRGPMALDSSGAVVRVVDRQSGTSSPYSIIVTEPTGKTRWSVDRGVVQGGPVLGRPQSGKQWLYLFDSTAPGALLAYDTTAAGGAQTLCAPTPGDAVGELSVADLQAVGDAAKVESVVGVASTAGTSALFAGRIGGSPACVTRTGVPPISGVASLRENRLFYPSPVSGPDRRIFSYALDPSGWLESSGYPVNSIQSSFLAVTDGLLLGGGGAQLFSVPLAGNTASWRFPDPPSGPTLGDVVVSAEGTLLFKGRESKLFEVVPGAIAEVAASPALSGSALGTMPPTLGEGGKVYVPSVGALDVLDRDLRRDWKYPDAELTDAAPLLDCLRDDAGAVVSGRQLGTAYLAGASGSVLAVIVDSRGMETAAKWPRHRRDSRNSSNASYALSEFQCP